MPYALKHSATGTLLSRVQRNGYKLDYYGIVQWDDVPEPGEIAEALAEAGISLTDEIGSLDAWEVLKLSEHEAKMANVKLRNDPRRVARYRDGVLEAETVGQ